MEEITKVLRSLQQGGGHSADELLSLVYSELRRLAAHRLSMERPGQTLQATALVHEAWMKLAREEDRAYNDSHHFFCAAAQAMRRILVDGTPVNPGVDPTGIGSSANDINDTGLVLVGIGPMDHPDEMGGVVVPLDTDADGEPDTWFADDDADGMNDLFFLTDAGHNLLPMCINEAGQVLSAQLADGDYVAGYLLTPDYSDTDGDGNPWFADGDSDGINDLLVFLESPEPGAIVEVGGLNNLGQVAGNSGGHAVRWEIVENTQIITDLGSLSDKIEMTAAGISDSGYIIGTSLTPTGRRVKSGPSWLIENAVIHELLPLMENPDGWENLKAYSINRYGWIEGFGRFDGAGCGFVAIPVEEP